MQIKKYLVPSVALVAIILGSSLVVKSIQAGQDKAAVTTVPLPLNAPVGAAYTTPTNLPGPTGGPYKDVATVKTLVLNAAVSNAGSTAKVSAVVRTTHLALITAGIFSSSPSVADNREVYLATVEGSFVFNRVPRGQDPVQASHINVEIDATTGDVLAVGTSTVTQDQNIVKKLSSVANTYWVNP